MRCFFIIGAQRSGTTFLYHLLRQHPEICIAKPVKPEPKYFLGRSDFNISHYLSTHFKHRKEEMLIGEKSTTYIENFSACEFIYDHLPESKFIIALRNPVHRALSNYYFSKQHHLETRTLRQAFLERLPEPELQRVMSTNPFDYVERGEYARYLNPIFRSFNPRRVHVMVFEEFTQNYARIQDLLKFLMVDDSFFPTGFDTKINASISKPSMCEDDEVLQMLYKHYGSWNERLFDILGRGIPDWEAS